MLVLHVLERTQLHRQKSWGKKHLSVQEAASLCPLTRLPPPRLMPFSATKSYSVPASMPSRCLEKPTRQTKMQKPPTSSSRKLNQLYGASASPWSRWFCSHFFFVFPFLFK